MQRANFQKNYLMRYMVLAGVCLFMALWFGYDGLIGYPAKLKYAQAYEQIEESDSKQRIESWRKLAAERGWPKDIPEKKAEEIADDIFGQYLYSLASLAVGLPTLFLLLSCRGSWVEETEEGLKTSWGQTVRFAEVHKLNKAKWDRKGIAKAYYTHNGRPKKFVFDDFKFEAKPLGAMLRRLEDGLTDEQIVGGKREPLKQPETTDEALV